MTPPAVSTVSDGALWPVAWLRGKPRSVRNVYAAVRLLCNAKGLARAGLAEICEHTRLARRTVQHALRRLIGARLLQLVTPGNGRGKLAVYLVRAFITAPVAYSPRHPRRRRGFPQERVHPRSYKETQELQKNRNPASQTRQPSPGAIVARFRRVSTAATHLPPPLQTAIVATVGRMCYRERRTAEFAARPEAVERMARELAAGLPRGLWHLDGAPLRTLYAHVRSWIAAELARCDVRQLITALAADPAPRPDTPAPRPGTQPRRQDPDKLRRALERFTAPPDPVRLEERRAAAKAALAAAGGLTR